MTKDLTDRKDEQDVSMIHVNTMYINVSYVFICILAHDSNFFASCTSAVGDDLLNSDTTIIPTTKVVVSQQITTDILHSARGAGMSKE